MNKVNAFKTTALVIGACICSFIIYCLQMVILGEGSGNISMSNPFISGFLHANLNHFFTNILFLFLLLLPPINQEFSFIRILCITTLLSFIYLPISLLGITQPAIGISGTWFFLLTRYFLSWNKNILAGKLIFWGLLIAEFYNSTLPPDGVAHLMHIFGSVLGYFSLTKGQNFLGLIPRNFREIKIYNLKNISFCDDFIGKKITS